MCGCGCESERERDRQTDRQTDRETEGEGENLVPQFMSFSRERVCCGWGKVLTRVWVPNHSDLLFTFSFLMFILHGLSTHQSEITPGLSRLHLERLCLRTVQFWEVSGAVALTIQAGCYL